MDVDALSRGILEGNRRDLARAITLIESARSDHRADAETLLRTVTESARQSVRIGLSGTPGVGKSTFIDAFGMFLIGLGLRVAVVAVDPSSVRTGGSILGDKTRMARLSREKNAFIRPSPSKCVLGGVARHTRDAITLCEAAGFDVVLVETVGVGQSEIHVADMSDLFILLLAPAGGDELQGVKRGIMEMVDLVVVNKADGDLHDAAVRTAADYASALHLLRKRSQDPDGFPATSLVSSLEGKGLDDVWTQVGALIDWRRENGFFEAQRLDQATRQFQEDLREKVMARLLDKPGVEDKIAKLAAEVARGSRLPGAAVNEILNQILESEDDG